jgi:hypothetical protein
LSYQSSFLLVSLAFPLLVVACHDEPTAPPPSETPPAAPQIVQAVVAPNPNNVISAILTLEVTGGASAWIEVDGDVGGPRATHPTPIAEAPVTLPLLGLYPDTDYRFRTVVAGASGEEVAGEWLPFRTGTLPASIAPLEISGSGPTPSGLTLLAPIRSSGTPHPVVLIDGTGRVVWYREVPGSVGDLQLQPNGHLTAAVGVNAIYPYTAGVYREWDALGNDVRTWTAVGYDPTDIHELRLQDGGGDAVLFGFEARTVDLTSVGLFAGATVIGDVLQRVSRDGTVLFSWDLLDHFSVGDADALAWQTWGPGGYDFSHANAIDLLAGGDYLISIRHLSVVTRVDGASGAVKWRMGKGRANQFRFVNDPKGGFWNQHAVRRLPNGNITLVDNGNGFTPPSSRAVEYAIDEQAKTATLVWSFEPGVASCCMGYAQRLANGNTLVNLGEDYRVFEVTAAGEVAWQASLPASGAGFFGIYRASRIGSLDELQ